MLLVALCFVAVTVVLIILDGLNDIGDHADVALVVGHEEYYRGSEPQLERVVKLYKDGAFNQVIVSASNRGTSPNEEAEMTQFLKTHGLPASAIIEDSGAADTAEMAADVAQILKDRGLTSVMIVTDYYRMSRLKMALLHVGIKDIAKAHVGSAHYEDAWPIAREVVVFYRYVFDTFLLPAAEKIKSEASEAASKAKDEAEKAKKDVDKNIEKLPK